MDIIKNMKVMTIKYFNKFENGASHFQAPFLYKKLLYFCRNSNNTCYNSDDEDENVKEE